MQRAPLPFAFARDNQVALDGALLLIGPEATTNGLREARRRAGAPVTPAPLPENDFQAALARLYEDTSSKTDDPDVAFDLEDPDRPGATRDLLEDATEAPVIRLVNQLLRQAVRADASDLHLEPHEDGLRARMRVDGTMQTMFDRRDVPARRVVSRLKVMARLDIAETRLPQDGRIALRLGGRGIDLRLSTLPGHYGERVVMRLLDRTTGLMDLDKLGLTAGQAALLQRLAGLPNGIILATGPTGSGKTTTLYAALTELNKAHRKIITAEDPIEYRLPRIQQVQVNPKIELDFARILRSALRQDPDVILVGEMRDQETVSVGVRAALTGHMVLSTLHTNDAISSAMRLTDMGVEPHLVASSLRAIVAQRLVRRICDNCSQPYTPDNRQRIWLSHLGHEPDEEVQYFRGQGCYQCNNTGYRGRIGVYELLELDDNMLFALRDQDPNRFVEAANRSPYFVNMTERALEYAREGITDLAEVFRITADLEDRDFGQAGSQKVRHGGAAGHKAARDASMAASTAPSPDQAADPTPDQPVEPLPSQDFQDSGLSLQPLDLDDDSRPDEDKH